MKWSDRVVSDQEKVETFDSICQMVIDTYDNPIRKGFEKASRQGQAGHDLVEILRKKDIIVPGKMGQERLKL